MSRLLSQRLCLRAPSTIRLYSFRPGPAPPKLPAAQQAEFERLQRAAAVSSAFQPEQSAASSATSGAATTPSTSTPRHTSAPTEEVKDVNQGLFRGAPPEFEGDVNPKTGEVGGPKNEPLRWGGQGDWSYNGRVTDF
ncbi:Fc.00g096750.m01.CDS01 [Cosmosporella sp. VM-42]